MRSFRRARVGSVGVLVVAALVSACAGNPPERPQAPGAGSAASPATSAARRAAAAAAPGEQETAAARAAASVARSTAGLPALAVPDAPEPLRLATPPASSGSAPAPRPVVAGDPLLVQRIVPDGRGRGRLATVPRSEALRLRSGVSGTGRAPALATAGPRSAPPVTSSASVTANETPLRLVPGRTYQVVVSLTNTTSSTLAAADWALSYRWFKADGSEGTDLLTKIDTPLPADLAPGASVTVTAKLEPPVLAGLFAQRESWTLAWDVWRKPLGGWLSASSPAFVPLLQQVTVQKPTSTDVGLEDFFQYSGVPTGGGGQLLVNQSTGNPVWSANLLANPSRGVSTFLRMTYNGCDLSWGPTGVGWSLGASQLTRLGSPLQFEGLLTSITRPEKVNLVDSDGTSHTFVLNKNGSLLDVSKWTYDSPAGVHLYLQPQPAAAVDRRWVMTRPDATRFFFDDKGYQTYTADRNGNELTFTYQRDLLGFNTGTLLSVTDPTGRRTLSLDYYQLGDTHQYFDGNATTTRRSSTFLLNPKIIGRVKSVTDVSGRVVRFVYASTGTLREVTDGFGSAVPRTFGFTYDGDLLAPKLLTTSDPRANSATAPQPSATKVGYYTDPLADLLQPLNRLGRVRTLTDRVGSVTTLDYDDPDGTKGEQTASTVTDANQHSTRVVIDAFGRPEQVVNAKGETTRMVWDADNNVVRLTENNGAVSTWEFDPLTGYPLVVTDAEAFADGRPGTRLAYRTRLDGRVADLVEKVSPEGRRWAFGYDAVGNLTSVTDPKGTATATVGDFTTFYTYDAFGQLLSLKDANGFVTTYGDYDPTGFPRRITDPDAFASVVGYSATGDVLTDTDPKNHTSTFTYDARRRPLVTRVPKDQASGVFLTTPAPGYDENDNLTTLTAANGAVTTTAYDAMDRPVRVTAPPDAAGGPAKVSTTTYDLVGNVSTSTSARGTATPTIGDFTTTFTYDALNRVTDVVDALGQRASARYDGVDNLVTIVDAKKNATSDPNDVTTTTAYDLSHRPIRVTDAAGESTVTEYDADGNVVATVDQLGNRTVYDLDERAAVREVRTPRDTGVVEVMRYEYDPVGNVTAEVSPRGTATPAPGDFTTVYVYDRQNRVSQRILPGANGDEIRYTYDATSNVRTVSTPPSGALQPRVDTTYDYFDNGWVRQQTDPFGVVTSYDYSALGQQSRRSVAPSTGIGARTQTWDYFPDGKLRTMKDGGVPADGNAVVTDNADAALVNAVGTWTSVDSAANTAVPAGTGATEGPDFRTHAASATTTDSFTWQGDIPASGSYKVYARWPAVAGQTSASNATFSIEHDAGTTAVTKNQRLAQGTWVDLGTYSFTEGTRRNVTLSGRGDGVVVADAVRWVRQGVPGEATTKQFDYVYDVDGNLTSITDTSTGRLVDAYTATYDDIGRAKVVDELKAGVRLNRTTYDYDPNGNIAGWSHDDAAATYRYDDPRDLLTSATVTPKVGPVLTPKTSTFRYDRRGLLDRQTKENGNTVDYTYFADMLLRTLTERKASQAVVNEHTYDYDPNGDKSSDVARRQNADSKALQSTTTTYGYDGRDRVSSVTKTGTGAGSETYDYDGADNVTRQVSTQGATSLTTTYSFNRNRLSSATTSAPGATATTTTYGYDVYGRQITASTSGGPTERWTYDGLDRTSKYTRGTESTTYVYDPFDRVRSKSVTKAGTTKTTWMDYLGLSGQTITERESTSTGTPRKTYQYTAFGELLSQVAKTDAGKVESSYYSFNGRGDVEGVTDENGDNRTTYGYTAYGASDASTSTGTDGAVGTEPANAFRFGAGRLDGSSGNYAMGGRTYSPGLARFLSLDQYNGALSDLSLASSPFTANRYSFAGGNPLNMLDATGHWPSWSDIGHAALDVAGLVPVVGEVADLANAGWYAAEGDYANAALSAASAIPFAGYAASAVKAGKYAVKGVKAVEAGEAAVKLGRDVTKGTEIAADVASGVERKLVGSGAKAGEKGAADAGGKAVTKAAPPKPKAPAPLRQAASAGESCLLNSFTSDTPVLLGDGSTRPISGLAVGDTVVATDPASGVTAAEPLTDVRSHEGVRRTVTLTVDLDGAAGSRVGTVTSTDEHPYWVDQAGRWVPAAELRAGQWLRGPDGRQFRVLEVTSRSAHVVVWNLTVATLHSFYVVPGGQPVLVHNAGGRRGCKAVRDQLDTIRDDFLAANPGWKHVGGGVDQATGVARKETWLRGAGGGLKGGSFADLTFEAPNGFLVYVNTVDTTVFGLPTTREARNALRLVLNARRAGQRFRLELIPK